MDNFHEHEFVDSVVHLDNKKFTHCKFRNCDLVFSGGELPILQYCRYERCRFTPDRDAARGIALLHVIYWELGEDGRRIVEDIFNAIREPPSTGE